VDSFYRGKTLTLVVFGSPGAANDVMARLVAQHMPTHIPGHPAITIKYMPGAGGTIAANYLYNVAAKDGTVFGTLNRATLFAPLEGAKGTEFDALKYVWIGSAAKDVMMGVTWHTSRVKTFEDAQRIAATIGSTGPTADLGRMPVILNATTGTKFNVIHGYRGAMDVLIAMERGEVEGRIAWSYDSILAQRPAWVKEHKINLILQGGLAKDPRIPEVPLAIDYARSPLDRQVLEFVFLPYEMSRPYVLPPGVPEDRVKALTKAFGQTMADADFLADAKASKTEVNPISGEAVAALIRKGYAMPASVLARVKAILSNQ
jgi:tripartite-type tricarboxylate transporter receptor subunit TctC